MVLQIELTVFLLLFISIISLLAVSGKKGLLSILSLAITILALIWIVIPLVDAGYNPALVTFISALPILSLMIYCNEGFSKLSHISIIATIFSFLIVSVLIEISVSLAHFTGIVSDLSATVGGQMGIDLPGILTAGIMIGSLGALIEMITTQVATVIELKQANPQFDDKQIYQQSYKVGVVHLSSIISTLFLIYAGASLPLLIIFATPDKSLTNILGYEPLSSEVVRILTGTIGVILALPISTIFAVWWLKRSKA
jgi:uncharacterized membrane protein